MPAAQPTQTTTGAFDSLRSWLNASSPAKIAGSLPEGSDGGKPATEGARSSENSADVKKVVPGDSIESGTNNPQWGNADKPVADSGLAQTTTGKMPEVEDAVKVLEKETAKMATADLSTAAGLDAAQVALTKAAAALPLLLTRLGISQHNTQQPTKSAAHRPADPTAAAFGYQTKEAADAAAEAVAGGYYKYGADRGMLTASYLNGFANMWDMLVKAADDGSLPQMLQGGGGDAQAGAPMPEAAPAAPMPAGPEAGAAPPPGGAQAGGEGQAPTVDDLAAAMAESGVTPEELEAVAAKLREQMGGGAGAPPGGAEPLPEEKAAMAAYNAELDKVVKIASEVREHTRSGKFRFKPAADGTPERKRRDAGREYIQELRRLGG